MFCKILSGGVMGVSADFVWVEVDIDTGLPSFSLVGSLSNEVRESRERVSVALKNAGFSLPAARITINLAPADVHKEGSGYDLPIAVGILEAMRYFSRESAERILFLGELGLGGELKTVRGVLPIVQAAREAGIRECIVPKGNAAEGAVIPGIVVRGAEHIGQVLEFLQRNSERACVGSPTGIDVEGVQEEILTGTDAGGVYGEILAGNDAEAEKILPRTIVDAEALLKVAGSGYDDFAQVSGQSMAKRAAEIAAAGFHDLLLIGPPGAGKSMIAKRMPGILPPLSLEESLEVTGIYSVAGELEEGQALVTERPFQAPHHTTTGVALLGGGRYPRPGLISLAHKGILFMDELPEFRREVIDSMRQPLEERRVQIARIQENIAYPANIMLVAAMNPCPCGYYPDRNRCRCTEAQIHKYRGKVSGPIMDRIDLWVELQAVALKDLQQATEEETTAEIQKRVLQARKRQEERFAETSRFAESKERSCRAYRFNADIRAEDMERFCPLDHTGKRLMERLYDTLQLGARAYHRILKVARTIADLAGEEQIREEHLLEAAGYRPGEM